MKRTASVFVASFVISIIFIMTLCGFMTVDDHTRRFGFGGDVPMFALEKEDDLHYLLTVMGTSAGLDLTPANIAAEYMQRLAPLVPAKYRLALQLVTFGGAAGEKAAQIRQEQDYYDNIKETP